MGVLKQMIDPFSSILHPCCGPETEVFSATSPVTADHNLATHLKKVTRKAQDDKGDYYKKMVDKRADSWCGWYQRARMLTCPLSWMNTYKQNSRKFSLKLQLDQKSVGHLFWVWKRIYKLTSRFEEHLYDFHLSQQHPIKGTSKTNCPIEDEDS